MHQNQQHPLRIKNRRILLVSPRIKTGCTYPILGKEDGFEMCVGGECNGIAILNHLVVQDIFDRVCQFGHSVAAGTAVADDHDVVFPACAGDDWHVLLSVQTDWDALRGVHSDVASGRTRHDMRVTQCNGSTSIQALKRGLGVGGYK
jgi:hypothetical protein